MPETYCGKSCHGCMYIDKAGCPGCKAGPGRAISGDCAIAVCCREKGHETCESCTRSANCGSYRGRDNMAEYRSKRQAAEAAAHAELMKRVPLLAKWLWVLFWLIVPSTIAELLALDFMPQSVAAAGDLLGFLCNAAYCVILLLLAPAGERYRTAGIYSLVGLVLSQLVGFTDGGWGVFLSLIAMIPAVVGDYNEYHAHAEALDGANADHAEKWRVLWKWDIGMTCGTFASILLMAVSAVLGALLVLATGVGALVVAVLKLVYLYQTAVFFREYPDR